MTDRLPLPHEPAGCRDIYVTRHHPLIVYTKRVEKLLVHFRREVGDTGPAVRLFGAGSTIKGALMLFQDTVARWPHLIENYRIDIGTTESLDLLETTGNESPTGSETEQGYDPKVVSRLVSTIQIDIFTRT